MIGWGLLLMFQTQTLLTFTIRVTTLPTQENTMLLIGKLQTAKVILLLKRVWSTLIVCLSTNIPLTDSLNVSAHLVNDSATYEGNPVNCLILDQLYWKEDYYPSGTLYGRWTFVHENVGVDQNEVLGINDVDFNTKPSLMRIVDILGRETPVKPNTSIILHI